MNTWRWMFPHILTVLLISVISRAQEASEPLPLPALLESAETLKAAGQWDAALAALGEAVARRAEDEESAAKAQLLQGRYRLQMAMPVEAEQALRDVEYLFPYHVEQVHWSRLFLIDALRFQGRSGDAEAVAQSLLASPTAGAKQIAWCRVALGDLLKEAGRLLEADEVLAPLDATVLPDGDVGPIVEGGLKRAEILLAWERPFTAATVLENIIARAGSGYRSQVNWARVRLMQALFDTRSCTRIGELADAVVADHGAGKATDQQLGWALLWEARCLRAVKQFESAVTPLQMASAASEKHADLWFQIEFELGEVKREHGSSMDMAYGGGTLHEEALDHYLAAWTIASDAGLPENDQDRARLQVASEMRHLGMRDRAIAWLRMGIENPAELDNADEQLAARMASFMTSDEAEAWQKYLLRPASEFDPTAGLVAVELGQAVPQPASAIVTRPYRRYYWLGRLYHDQGRYDEAIGSYVQARQIANDPGDAAESLTGLLRAYYGKSRSWRTPSEREEAKRAEATAKSLADQAAGEWLAFAPGAPRGDAHYATEQAVEAYFDLRLPAEALPVADEFVAVLAGAEDHSKLAFALYIRSRALAWNRRYDEAIQAALDLDRSYADDQDPDIREIRAAALVRAVAYYAWSGDPASGLALLDTVEQRWPGRYTHWMPAYRRLCEMLME